MESAEDRRAYYRVHVEAQVKLKVILLPDDTRDAPRRLTGVTSDVSFGGSRMTLLTGDSIPVGARAKLKLIFERPHKTISLMGEVRWVHHEPMSTGHVIGVDVTDSPAHALKVWRKFIETHLVA